MPATWTDSRAVSSSRPTPALRARSAGLKPASITTTAAAYARPIATGGRIAKRQRGRSRRGRPAAIRPASQGAGAGFTRSRIPRSVAADSAHAGQRDTWNSNRVRSVAGSSPSRAAAISPSAPSQETVLLGIAKSDARSSGAMAGERRPATSAPTVSRSLPSAAQDAQAVWCAESSASGASATESRSSSEQVIRKLPRRAREKRRSRPAGPPAAPGSFWPPRSGRGTSAT